MNKITLIKSTTPSSLAKTYYMTANGIQKHAVAHVTEGEAVQYTIDTAKQMVKLLESTTKQNNVAICAGGFHGAEDRTPFRMVSEGQLARAKGLPLGHSDLGGVHDIAGQPTAARLKRGMNASAWILLDADNPPGMPKDWAAMTIAQRLALWEPMLPGISACERIELRGSSARVVNGSGSKPATHAWLRISDPDKIHILKTYVATEMVLQGLSFTFEKHSKITPGKVCGIESRSVFDLAVWDTGRLVFCSQPQLVGLDAYTVDDPDIIIVNEGCGPLDVTFINEPQPARLHAYKEKTGVDIKIKREGLSVENTGQLTMDTEIEVKGVVKSLGAWVAGMAPGSKLRCESPFRESKSEAAMIRLGDNGEPFVYDIGNGVTYKMRVRNKVAKDLEARLLTILPKDAVSVNDDVVERVVTSIYFNPVRRYYHMLNGNELIEVKDNKLLQFIRLAIGDVIDYDKFSKGVSAMALAQPSEAKSAKFIKEAWALPQQIIADYIEFTNQRTDMNLVVDMFASQSSITMGENVANVTLTHTKFKHGPINQAVVDDFKEHFGDLDEFLEWIAACRFASNRKKSFVWMKATSDFGKSFLSTAMNRLGLVVEMSTTEVEAIFEGKVSPRSPHDFKSAWVLLVEEFKSTKSELKQLQQSMTVNQKFKGTANINLYAKLFLSAEDVSSLVGDDLGAEAQFANRFSLLEKSGVLTTRPLFMQSSDVYMDGVRDYVAYFMNAQVEFYRKLGPRDACNEADIRLNFFHSKHGIAVKYSTIDIGMDEICGRFNDFIEGLLAKPYHELSPKNKEIVDSVFRKGEMIWVKRARKIFAEYVDFTYTRAEAGRLYPKISQFIRDYYGGSRIVRYDSKSHNVIGFIG